MSSPDTGGGATNTNNSSSGEKTNPIIKQNTFPMDLAPKIALVKPTDGKGSTVQTQFRWVEYNLKDFHSFFCCSGTYFIDFPLKYRTLPQQPMRVVVPTGTAGTQIIQTQLMPQAMLKQGDY